MVISDRFSAVGLRRASIRLRVCVLAVVVMAAASVGMVAADTADDSRTVAPPYLSAASSQPSSTATSAPLRRIALVIGNATYRQDPLRNPRHDAADMARTLASTGFEVMTILDGNRDDITAAIKEFGRRIDTPQTVALFYYAGHGVQVRGDNYLIPVDARITTVADISEQSVALERVFDELRRADRGTNILILDACRDNPFADSLGSRMGVGLAPVVAPANTIIGYATAPGQVAEDGRGGNSPYTAGLTASIPVPGLSIEDVFRAARRSVMAATDSRQTSWEHSSLVGGFVFVDKPASSVLGSDALAASASREGVDEIALWQSIRTSHDASIFNAHLARYPDGLFADLARMRIATIEAAQAMAPWRGVVTGTVQSVTEAADAEVSYHQAMALAKAPTSGVAEQQQAAAKFAEAASAGHVSAMFELARSYDKGLGVGRDLAQAARWYQLAAEHNHASAMASLGTMYEYGEGVPRDLAEALRYYQLAADRNDPGGLTNLGYLYHQGKGVTANAETARALYQNAAALGQVRAMHNLALLYLDNRALSADKGADAISLLKRAATHGYVPALRELANVYDRGRGTARDPARAADYVLQYLRAAHRGSGDGSVTSIQSWRYATRRQIQKRLAARGLYDGIAHGFMNEATRRALLAVSEN